MEYKQQFEITNKTSVVIINSDPVLTAQLSTCLMLDGYGVHSFKNLDELSLYLTKDNFDIGIFSLDSVDSSATHFLKKHALFRNKGIIFTTQKTDPLAKIIALKEGADYCISLPLVLEELTFLTLNLALRLSENTGQGWVLDRKKWALISPNSQCIKLTNLELLIVQALAACEGKVVSKDDIAEAMGYSPSVYDFRRLEVIIRRLRNKAQQTLGFELPLKTAHRRGYAFTDNIRVLDF